MFLPLLPMAYQPQWHLAALVYRPPAERVLRSASAVSSRSVAAVAGREGDDQDQAGATRQ